MEKSKFIRLALYIMGMSYLFFIFFFVFFTGEKHLITLFGLSFPMEYPLIVSSFLFCAGLFGFLIPKKSFVPSIISISVSIVVALISVSLFWKRAGSYSIILFFVLIFAVQLMTTKGLFTKKAETEC